MLVVEDEPLIAMNVVATLDDGGYEVVGRAGDVEMALRWIDARPCDLAVLDINLVRETSEQVAQMLS